MSHQQQIIHPFIFFLVHGMSECYDSLLANPSDQRAALKSLFWLIPFLEKKGKDKLTEQLQTMRNVLKGETDLDSSGFELWKLIDEIMSELHEEGYFLAAKHTPPTRTSTLKDMRIEADRARLEG